MPCSGPISLSRPAWFCKSCSRVFQARKQAHRSSSALQHCHCCSQNVQTTLPQQSSETLAEERACRLERLTRCSHSCAYDTTSCSSAQTTTSLLRQNTAHCASGQQQPEGAKRDAQPCADERLTLSPPTRAARAEKPGRSARRADRCRAARHLLPRSARASLPPRASPHR